MKISLRILLFVLIVVSFSACSSELNEKLTPVPIAYGKVNELVLIADKNLWEGPVGDTIRYYLSSAYIILPQPEPVLDIRFYEPQDLKAVTARKNFRNYLFVGDLDDETSPTTQLMREDLGSESIYRANQDPGFNISVGSNKWAKDQILIYQFANDYDALIENIKKNAAAIVNRVIKHDDEIVEANIYQGGVNADLVSLVDVRLGVDLKVPFDYFLALDDTVNNTVWLRKENDFLSSNIILHRYPYSDKEQLSKKGIKKVLNELGQIVSVQTEIVEGEPVKEIYKVINDVDLPMYTTNVQMDGKYAVEARGIWEMVNYFMGGPYISYSIVDPATDEILVIEGFVHAPGKKKRDYMQQLEHIFKTLKL